MTNEEAAHIVDVAFGVPLAVRRIGENRTYHADEIREAKNMAIKALEQEPCEDVIMTNEERKKAIDALKKSAPVMAVTQEEFNDYIKTLNKIMDSIEQEPCGDTVSRQAIMEHLSEVKNSIVEQRNKPKNLSNSEMLIGMQMCIEDFLGWLQAEMPENPNNCDLISRKALISHIENQSREWGEDYDVQQILGDIEDLPSVKPQTEIIRCSQCKYAEVADSEDSQDGYTCQFHRGSIWFSGSYCSWAERSTNGK